MEATFARAIINKLGGTGTPPEFGIETFTIGLERYLAQTVQIITELDSGVFAEFIFCRVSPERCGLGNQNQLR